MIIYLIYTTCALLIMKKQGSRYVRKSTRCPSTSVTRSIQGRGLKKQKGRRYRPEKKEDAVTRLPRGDERSKNPSKDEGMLDLTKSNHTKTFRSNTPTEDYILSFGLSKIGFGDKRQCRVSRHLNIDWFKTFFGFFH